MRIKLTARVCVQGEQVLPAAIRFLLDFFRDFRKLLAREVNKRGAHTQEELLHRNLLPGLLGVVIELGDASLVLVKGKQAAFHGLSDDLVAGFGVGAPIEQARREEAAEN